MKTLIPIEVKKTCCQMKAEGKCNREIYNYYRSETNAASSIGTFRSLLSRWSRQQYPDTTTLECGTYEGFIAHDATVQVSKTGEIVQAWIKQKACEFDHEDFLAAIR